MSPPGPRRLHLPASPARAAGKEKKKKKKKLRPSIPGMRFLLERAGGGGGVGGRGGRPQPRGAHSAGRGPSMAEPLLRKTFSRLRGREKLPRKKSEAKDRGECGDSRKVREGSPTQPQIPRSPVGYAAGPSG
jgi:hypothetical protein